MCISSTFASNKALENQSEGIEKFGCSWQLRVAEEKGSEGQEKPGRENDDDRSTKMESIHKLTREICSVNFPSHNHLLGPF